MDQHSRTEAEQEPFDDIGLASRTLKHPLSGTQRSQRSSRSSCDEHTTTRTKSKFSNASILDEDDLIFTHGPMGMQIQHSTALLRTRGLLRELGQNMLQSMTTSIPREVWDACEIPHPEQEREEKAEVHVEVKRLRAAEKAAEKIRSLETPIFRSQEVNIDGMSTRRSQTISYRPERQEEKDKLHQEQVIAWLARQTGWSVLDVEEMREVFVRHAMGGRVDVHSQVFQRILCDLYTEPSAEEVRSILHHVTKARRRTVRRSVWQSIVQNEDESHTEPTWIHFSEFYLGLVKWLDHQRAKQLAKHCRLSRFKVCDRIKALQRENNAVDYFRKEIQTKGEPKGETPKGDGGRRKSFRQNTAATMRQNTAASLRQNTAASLRQSTASKRSVESIVSDFDAADNAEDSRSGSPQQLSEEDENSESEGSNIGASDPGDFMDDEDFFEPASPAGASFVV